MVHPRQKKKTILARDVSKKAKISKNGNKSGADQLTKTDTLAAEVSHKKKNAFSQQPRARKIAKVLKTNVPVTILKDEKWRNAKKRFSLEGCQKKKKRAKTAILTAEVSKKKKIAFPHWTSRRKKAKVAKTNGAASTFFEKSPR